jgi:hypothetical protein
MRPIFVAAFAAVAAMLSIAAAAAPPEPDSPPPQTAAARAPDERITFDDYRAWRLAAMERRRSEIDLQLATADLPAARKARLEETRTYYNWLARLPAAERDRRFRERFDRMDANHDGIVDADERGAWREQQRAFYGGKKREPQHPASN